MRPLAALLASALATAAHAVPTTIAHQGRVLDAAGGPITGTRAAEFRIYGAASGGSPLWSEAHTLSLQDGTFAVLLGEADPLDTTVLDGGARWLAVALDGQELGGRMPIVATAYAIAAGRAEVAAALDGGPVDASELRVDGDVIVDSAGRLAPAVYESAYAAAHLHRLSGRYFRLYGLEVLGTDNNPSASAPHLNMTATRGNYIGSAVFEMVGAPHCGYCYSGGPKAIIYRTGTVSFAFHVKGGEVYVALDDVNTLEIRSTTPIAPAVLSALPAGTTPVAAL